MPDENEDAGLPNTNRRVPQKPVESPALHEAKSGRNLVGVSEGEVGAEGDHAEAGGGALADNPSEKIPGTVRMRTCRTGARELA